MTRTQSALYRARHVLWVFGIVLFAGGLAAVVWLVLDRDRLATDLEQEANLRGEAVSTLAGDVRALRSQVQAGGETPVAPDPSRAVEDLPDRAEVPVPIPGPPGPVGPSGPSGAPAPTITPSPGATGPRGPAGSAGPPGAPGIPGVDSTVPGPSGAPGQPGRDATGAPGRDGKDGTDGRDGAAGQPPASWTFEYGGATYTCRPVDDFDPNDPQYTCDPQDSNPDDSDSDSPRAIALDPQRRQYA